MRKLSGMAAVGVAGILSLGSAGCSSSSGDDGASPGAADAGAPVSDAGSADGAADAAAPVYDLDVSLVKDIDTRGAGSSPYFYTDGSFVYFSATAEQITSFWRTDGTPAGTTEIVALPAAVTYAHILFALGSKIVFVATTADAGAEAWVTDGTASGTVMLADIAPGILSSSPNAVGVLGGNGYFIVDGGLVYETDGTPGGTKPFAAGATMGTGVVVGSTIFFESLPTETVGAEPWISDGTPAGTKLLRDINPSGSSSPGGFTKIGAATYFFANDGTHGMELWSTDGTNDGTKLVADQNPGAAGSVINGSSSWLGALGSEVFFQCNTPAAGRELCKSDGTTAGTGVVADIAAGAAGSSPRYFAAYGGRLYFFASDGVHGTNVWSTDGTTAGTTLLKAVQPATNTFAGNQIVATNDGIFFAANDGTHGTEPWRSDGTAAGTTLVADVMPGPLDGYTSFSIPFAVSGNVYFAGTDPTTDSEPYAVTSHLTKATLLADVAKGTSSANPFSLVLGTDRVFFVANDGVTGSREWSTDGTEAGTQIIADSTPASGTPLVYDGDRILYCATDAAHGAELWTTSADGKSAALVLDIAPGATNGCIAPPTALAGGWAYFVANDGTNGSQIWKTQGTAATTTPVTTPPLTAPYAPYTDGNIVFFQAMSTGDTFGSLYAIVNGGAPVKLGADGFIPNGQRSLSFDGKTYLQVADFAGGANGVYTSDGTVAGTKRVLTRTYDTMDAIGTHLVMSADTSLWVWDPTNVDPHGTLVKATTSDLDGYAGTTSAFTAFGSGVWFFGGNGTYGIGAWTSDLTGAGTKLVAPYAPRAYGSVWEIVLGGWVYFGAATPDLGSEIFESDGTAANTHAAADVYAGVASSNAQKPVVLGDAIYFAADDGTHGAELMRGTRRAK